MKILHINSYYGKSLFYKNLYDTQMQKGLDIDVFVSVPTSFHKSDFNYGEYTKISKNHGRFDRFLFHFKHNKIYKDICKKIKISDYSIIHAHSLFSNGYIAYRLKMQFGTPYIVAVRNTDVNVFFKKMVHLRNLGIKILEEANHVVFLSESYKVKVINQYLSDDFKEMFLSKTSVVPNGVDAFWLNHKGSPKSRPKLHELKLFYAGVINRNKNILTTVRAIKVLQKSGMNVKLTIVGRIEDQSIFSKFTDLDFVRYLPPKSKEELLELYRQNDIFILPSIHESFGIVYLEAMSQGLPIIYTKGQGFDGNFNDGHVGYRVSCFDYEEIANRITRILNDYEEISLNCLRQVERFNWESINNEYLSLYSRIGAESL